MAALNFNAREVDPSTTYDALPKGKYQALATESEMKQTKNRDGEYLQITWEIVEGQFKGRKLWSRLNLRNKSKQAVDIANRELSAICHATGVLDLQDSAQLHNIVITLDVGIDKGDASQNVIRGYAKPGVTQAPGAPRAAASRPAAAQQATPPAQDEVEQANTAIASIEKKKPWERNK